MGQVAFSGQATGLISSFVMNRFQTLWSELDGNETDDADALIEPGDH